jgi:glycosyltransferase involved in cell wall biosynthesis
LHAVPVETVKPLRIAWLGPVPGGTSGARGVGEELLRGLADLGHKIDCFFPIRGHQLSPALAEHENLSFVWGTSPWKWNRWYSRTKIGAFASGLIARGRASMQLRQEIALRHAQEPYDLVYQFSSIETPALPSSLRRSAPLVIHPETHVAGELRWLIKERRLGLRSQPAYVLIAVATILAVRVVVQRLTIRRASLLVCISAVFRDHLVHDYGFPAADTVVIPNPVRVDRFDGVPRELSRPPTVLVLGRISVRKGVEDVLAVARVLLERGVAVRVRILGNPSLWSDYTRLLDELPPNTEYTGRVPPEEIPLELARSDVLLQASKYEPFGLTVGEALAAGVPVVATSEVGAIEGVARSVIGEVEPGDVEGMATAIVTLLERTGEQRSEMEETARAEAARLFAPERVCEQISAALERLVHGAHQE